MTTRSGPVAPTTQQVVSLEQPQNALMNVPATEELRQEQMGLIRATTRNIEGSENRM